MMIYWRIGQLVLVVFVIIQAIIFAADRLSLSTETIQETAQTLLQAHLHQRLPKYYYKVSKATQVWEVLPSTERQANRLLDTLFPGRTVTVIDSAFISDNQIEHRWLKIDFDDTDHHSHTGWILAHHP